MQPRREGFDEGRVSRTLDRWEPWQIDQRVCSVTDSRNLSCESKAGLQVLDLGLASSSCLRFVSLCGHGKHSTAVHAIGFGSQVRMHHLHSVQSSFPKLRTSAVFALLAHGFESQSASVIGMVYNSSPLQLAKGSWDCCVMTPVVLRRCLSILLCMLHFLLLAGDNQQ